MPYVARKCIFKKMRKAMVSVLVIGIFLSTALHAAIPVTAGLECAVKSLPPGAACTKAIKLHRSGQG